MNNKGEMSVGVVITLAIGIIIGIILLTGGITDGVSKMTDKSKVVNGSLTAAQWYTGNVITLNGKVVSDVIVINTTGGDVLPATNYTIANNVILSDGTIGSTLTVKSYVIYNNSAKNISYTYEPVTYVSDTGTRTVVTLIVIMSCLAIAVYAMSPVLRETIHGAFS